MKITIKKGCINAAYLPYVKDYTRRYEVYYGGAGSGKSVFVVQKLIIKALESKRKILVIRKVGATLRDSVYALICDTLARWQILRLCKTNVTNMSVILPNGSTFLFKGLDDSEKIKSIADITDIWVEEATELTGEEYDQLDLRLRARVDGSQLIATFNPVSKANWTYSRWFDPATAAPDRNVLVVKTTYKDNAFLTPQYIASLEAMITTNPAYYNIYALGEFATLDRLVYNRWRVEDYDWKALHGTLCIGLDFGFVSDPTALVASIVTDDTIYIFDCWGATCYTNDMIARAIADRGYAKSTIICDSAEQKSIAELRQHGIIRAQEATKGQHSIINGIKKVSEYDIAVAPACAAVIEELQNYAWAKDRRTGEYIEQPIDQYNHYMDALRYSLQCVTNSHKPKFLPKSYLGI